MIASKDRSGWFGASDTDKIVGNWETATFEKWWMEKLGIMRNDFQNTYLLAGTYLEHRILGSLGIPMEMDKQILMNNLKLRVNLDGNTSDTIYECKTHKDGKPFRMPKKYTQQVNVQMYATGMRRAFVVVYTLHEEDYENFFLPIDKDRISSYAVEYDEKFIADTYLPRLSYLRDCLAKGTFPDASFYKKNH